jgi:hypothetical protein
MLSVKGRIQNCARSMYLLLSNRRKFDRQPIQAPICVNTKNKYGQIATVVCTCVDISARGLAVESNEPIVANADAYVQCDTHGLKGFAFIRYCRLEAGRYRIGMEFRSEPECWV